MCGGGEGLGTGISTAARMTTVEGRRQRVSPRPVLKDPPRMRLNLP
jgi:hypothetical protein